MQYAGNLGGGGGSAATLAILEKIEVLETKMEVLENENRNLKKVKMSTINTSVVLNARTFVSGESIYTATQNCWVQASMKSGNKLGGNIQVNGTAVFALYSESAYIENVVSFFLQKGDVLKVVGNSTYAANYAIYGAK